MEIIQHQKWRMMRFSFRNATIVVCLFNLLCALLLLQGFLSASSNRKLASNQLDAGLLRHMKESEEMRRAMEPLELMKRVREIEQEAYGEPETFQQKVTKQTAAVDLSKRLKGSLSSGDAATLKVLEEWRKRKMERARQRELEKNGTVT